MFPFAINPVKAALNLNYEGEWGGFGSDPGQFSFPDGVAFDSVYETIIVADTGNARVQGFDTDGSPLWVSPSYSSVGGVAVSNGVVYVTDPEASRVHSLNAGTGEVYYSLHAPVEEVYSPGVIAVENSQYFYTRDLNNPGTVEKREDNDGVLLYWLSSPGFDSIGGIDFDDVSGNLYITDPVNTELMVLDTASLDPIDTWDTGVFQPEGVAVDASGNVFATDAYADVVIKFNSVGDYLGSFGGPGSGPGQFFNPMDVAVDNSGFIYVADRGNHRIQKFSSVEDTFLVMQGADTWIVEPIHGSVSAEEFYDYYLPAVRYVTTEAILHLWPNPVQVGQPLEVSGWVAYYLPPLGEFFHDLTVVVTGPGVSESINIAESDGSFSFDYIPVDVGWYYFQLFYPGDDYEDGSLVYLPSQTGTQAVEVTVDSQPSPSPEPPPTLVELPPADGSGHTPYMETDKGKIYLYEDLEGELSLIFHHGADAINPLEPAYTWAYYYFEGLPVDSYVALEDDPEDIIWVGGEQGEFSGYKAASCSDGAIISGLSASENWAITVLLEFESPSELDTWEYQTETGVITLNLEEPLIISSANLCEITVNNALALGSPEPEDDWEYVLINDVETIEETFYLPAAGGGSISFSSLLPGTYLLAQTRKFNYETDITLNEAAIDGEIVDNTILLTFELFPGETALVEFASEFQPDAAWGKKATPEDSSPPSMMTYNLPCRRAIPVQTTWDPDIEPDDAIDLVKDKATKILVNMSDVLVPYGPIDPGDSETIITVSLTWDPADFNSLQTTITGAEINDNNIIIFTPDPLDTVGDYTITCTITGGAVLNNVEDTLVSIKETSELTLYYSHLILDGEYGNIMDMPDPDAYETMLTNTRDFISATYPVPNVEVYSNQAGLAGVTYEDNYLGLLKDCINIAEQAKLTFPESPKAIGVAIGPDLQSGGKYANYFKYHGAYSGKKTAVGVSFGPGVKGVAVLDGYYSAAAHEIGHTFNLYYGVPEQYELFDPGISCNGFRAAENEWRSGYDFMGLSPYQTTANMWVNTDTTFDPLFSSLKTAGDCPLILVNGIIYQDDEGHVTAVDLPETWYSMPYGTPDTFPEGEHRFAIRFTLDDESTVETSFYTQFFLHVDPGIEIGEDLPEDFTGFGAIETNFAGFAFAVVYPQGTVAIELVEKTQSGDQVIGEFPVEDVESVTPQFSGFLPPIDPEGNSRFSRKMVIPVKFQLQSAPGVFITTASAELWIAEMDKYGEFVTGDWMPAPSATPFDLFRYDPLKNQYVFNLDANGLSKGYWQLEVRFEDGTSENVRIRLM